MKKVFALLILLLSNISISQDQTTDLDEVVVLSTKIDLPFLKILEQLKLLVLMILKIVLQLTFLIYYKKLQESMLEEEALEEFKEIYI